MTQNYGNNIKYCLYQISEKLYISTLYVVGKYSANKTIFMLFRNL